jgi:hypothetical protein
MNPHTSRIGCWAATLATGFGFAFSVAAFAQVAGVLAAPWDTFWMVAPSIFLVWCYMILMACILDAAPPDRKIWATIGLGFALIYATMNSIVYMTVLAVVIPHVLQNQSAAVAVLLFEPGHFLIAVNGLAYGLMSISALFAAPVFVRRGLETRIRQAMVAHGVLAPIIVGALAWPWLTYLGALWMVTFPVMTILLATWFRTAKLDDHSQ